MLKRFLLASVSAVMAFAVTVLAAPAVVAGPLETVSDVRVGPLLATKWSQLKDSIYTNYGEPCYNYYTPNNYPCGCVATAGAQIMKYHRHPVASVTPGTYPCAVSSASRSLTMQGGVYDWDRMPEILPDRGGTDEAARQAIGRLTSDLGIACYTQYGESSGAGGYTLAPALTTRFGYANAIALMVGDGGIGLKDVHTALRTNLDAGLPVMLSLVNTATGFAHSLVADGYGFEGGVAYYHLNFGWAGKDDAWYPLPSAGDPITQYDAVDSLVCNVYPDGVAGGVICSGRVLSEDGSPVVGATVSVRNAAMQPRGTCVSDENGIYALILRPGSHILVAEFGELSGRRTVSLSACVGLTIEEDLYYGAPYSLGRLGNLAGQDLKVVVGGGAGNGGLRETLTDVSSSGAVNPKGATYNGFLTDASGLVSGTYVLTVKKMGKDGRTAAAKMTVTELSTGKKTKISGTVDVQSGVCSGELSGLFVGSVSVDGALKGRGVQGVLNVAKAKNAAGLSLLAGFNKSVYGFALTDARGGVAAFTCTMGMKGKAKVAGNLADGTKVSASTTMCVGDRCCVPFVFAKKGVKMAGALWFDKSSRKLVSVSGLPSGYYLLDCGQAFPRAGNYVCSSSKGDLALTFNGKKFVAGKLVKISYKKGALKGSYTIETKNGAKTVKSKYTVVGVMIGSHGYATAYSKKLGSFPVDIGR